MAKMFSEQQPDSSLVAAFGLIDGKLAVEFHSRPGVAYVYENTGSAEYEGMRNAPSVGRWFQENIRQYSDQHEYTTVDIDD